MSSFRRAAPRAAPSGVAASPATTLSAAATASAKRALPGTKPFLNGQALVSTGLAQLDAIVGGGYLLGTLVLLDAPRQDAAAATTGLVDDLHRYFVAEGVVAAQTAVLVSDDAAAFVAHQLPLELSMAQKQVKAQLADPSTGEPLTIAWQYQKYLADAVSGADKPRFCHSFDLSRAMHEELLRANAPAALDLSDYCADGTAVGDAYATLFVDIAREVETRSHGATPTVVRVCVRELGSPLLGPPTHAHMAALVGFVRRLRHLASSTRSLVVQLSGHLYAFPAAFANELRHLSDYVLELKSFVGESDLLPGELAEFHGLLDVKKLARVHALACHSLDAIKFGVKRERRKLKIEKFHLPPEGSRSAADKDSTKTTKRTPANAVQSNLVSSSFTRASSSAVGCGSSSSTSTAMDPLDF